MSNRSTALVRYNLGEGWIGAAVDLACYERPEDELRRLALLKRAGGVVVVTERDLSAPLLRVFSPNDAGMYAYVLSINLRGELFHKVGVTKNVRSRFRHIISSMPPAITSFASGVAAVCNIETAPWIEEQLLAAYRDRWAGGEWVFGNKQEATDGR